MNHKIIYRAVLVFTILASLIFGVFMTLSIAQSADGTISDINAYSADKVKFFKLISWLFFASLAGFLCFTFIYKSKFYKSFKVQSASYKVVSVLGCLTSISVVIYSTVAEFLAGTGVSISYITLVLLSALSATYFFVCAFSDKNKYSNLFTGLSLFPPIALATKLIIDFLAQNSNGYGQLYNYHLLSLGFFLLFFINESRFYMRQATPSLYVFFGLAAALSTTVFALPVLSLSMSGVVHSNATNIVYCTIDLLMTVYVYIKLFNIEVKIPKATKHGVMIED